jgi:hypothetical protein
MCATRQTPKTPPIGALVEVRDLRDSSPQALRQFAQDFGVSGCEVDLDYAAVPMGDGATHVIRCVVSDESVLEQLRKRPDVTYVTKEGRAEPF